MTKQHAIESLSFETALKELEEIVRSLETGEAALEESITAYERGTQLKTHCEKKLRDAQEKIEKISVQKDGSVTMQPFDSEQ